MERVKLKMNCKCGESIVLRGSLMNGNFETGFKKCFCGNADPELFNIEILERYKVKIEEIDIGT